MKIRLLELFGGIGACSKALERLRIDYEIADYVEIDKYAVASFNAMHNTNFEPQDIVEWNKDIDVDLIFHGSPCQDFSLAGKGAGGDEGSGTRSSLMYETIRIVEKLKPKYVIWENVPNVLSKKHIHNFQNYIQFLDNLGYKSAYEVLNAKDYGIPQNRERLFVVSVLNGRTRDLLGLELYFDFPQPIQLKLKLKDLLEEEVDEKYYLSDKMLNYMYGVNQRESKFPRRERFEANINRKNQDIANSVTTNAGNRPTDNFVKDNRNLKEQLCDYLVQNNLVKENDVINHSYSSWRAKQEFHTENSRNNNISATLTTRPDTLGIAVKDETIRIRKLTPREVWRLMGFNDEEFEKAKKVNSDTQLYKQAGNSIVINVLEAIFKELFKL